MNKSQPLLDFYIDNANRNKKKAEKFVSMGKLQIQAKTLKKLNNSKNNSHKLIDFNPEKEVTGLKYCQIELARFESSVKFKDKKKTENTKQSLNKERTISQKEAPDRKNKDRNSLMQKKLYVKLEALKD